jgi:anti-sigma B factor antagonist
MSDHDLSISVEKMPRVDLVTVNGRIDSSSAGLFENRLDDITTKSRYNLILNLAGVSYMSSAGLRTLVKVKKVCSKGRGDLRLSQLSPRVQEVLDLSGLTSIFETYDNDTTAVGSF